MQSGRRPSAWRLSHAHLTDLALSPTLSEVVFGSQHRWLHIGSQCFDPWFVPVASQTARPRGTKPIPKGELGFGRADVGGAIVAGPHQIDLHSHMFSNVSTNPKKV